MLLEKQKLILGNHKDDVLDEKDDNWEYEIPNIRLAKQKINDLDQIIDEFFEDIEKNRPEKIRIFNHQTNRNDKTYLPMVQSMFRKKVLEISLNNYKKKDNSVTSAIGYRAKHVNKAKNIKLRKKVSENYKYRKQNVPNELYSNLEDIDLQERITYGKELKNNVFNLIQKKPRVFNKDQVNTLLKIVENLTNELHNSEYAIKTKKGYILDQKSEQLGSLIDDLQKKITEYEIENKLKIDKMDANLSSNRKMIRISPQQNLLRGEQASTKNLNNELKFSDSTDSSSMRPLPYVITYQVNQSDNKVWTNVK